MDRAEAVLAGWGLVLSARGLGEWLQRPFRLEGPRSLTRFVCATGLGLGGIALFTLAVGTLGAVRWAPAICAVGLLLSVRPVFDDLRAAYQACHGFRWVSWEGALLLPAMVSIPATLLFSLLPPADYDVLEYHLGAPAQYLRLGRIAFLPWNVYASFPENAEMLYTCLLTLFHSSMAGGMAAAAMNVAIGVVCALAVADLATEVFGRAAAIPAAVIFYAYPLTWIVSGQGYVEIEQAFFSMLCVRALIARGRTAALAGVFAGLAMGTKYPAALFVALPVGVFLLLRLRIRAAIAYGICATVLVSPWMIKNFVATGNPVYPLLGSIIPAKGWTAEKEAKFHHAHFPPIPSSSAAMTSIETELTGVSLDEQGSETWSPPRSSVLIVLAPLLFLLPREGKRPRAGWGLLALAVWHAGAWWFFTHRIDRFFYPGVPWFALIAAGGISAVSHGGLRHATHAVVALIVWFHSGWGAPNVAYTGVADFVLESKGPLEYLNLFNHDQEATFWVNENLPSEARVLLLGEAQTFYSQRDFVAATVFDDCPMPLGNSVEVREALRRAGITHVLVNWYEVDRLRRTYRYDFEGSERPGYSDAVLPERFQRLERDVLERVRGFGDGGIVLYRVRSG